LEHTTAKCEKYKAKLTSVEEALKNTNFQHDTLKVAFETIKTKNEVTLVEREKEITTLKDQLNQFSSKEKVMAEKIEAIE